MQRNSKQVLLKYNTVDRRTVEDDALMCKIKTLLRWFFLIALLFFPFMFYVPLYSDYNVERRPAEINIYGWGPNTSRSVPLYIIPDNDTSLILNSQLCAKPLLLLIVVCSAVNNTLERLTIRETWGNFSAESYRLAFLLGTTDNTTLQKAIEEESSMYNDIIQENFIDTYNNLTLKSVMLLKFVTNHCDKVEYIFKADDDMFTYIPNLVALIKLVKKIHLGNVLIGHLICGAKPILEINNKWYSPRYMFREREYPRYLSGTGYLMDRQTATKLYQTALEIPYLHLEDVFITGLCARKARIKPRHHSGFSYNPRPLDPCLYKQDQNVISSHKVTVDNMRQLFASFNNATACSGAKNVTLSKPDFLKAPVRKKNRCL